jgi:hypothetical protein
MGGKERLPARWGGSSAKELQRRIDAVPDWIRPAFSEFRDYVHDRAGAYQSANPRPNPRTLRRYLGGFVKAISEPLEIAQWGAVAAGYYVPLPDTTNWLTAGAGSAVSAFAGETLVWGSAFTAVAGGMAIATVSEMLDVYAIASARTQRYRWAQLAPGPDVIRAEVVTILDATGQSFARGTLGQLGLGGLGHLAAHAAEGIIGDLSVPAYGALRGGWRTRAALKEARVRTLSPMPENGPPPEPDLGAPPPSSFYDWFRREGQPGYLRLMPGGVDAS